MIQTFVNNAFAGRSSASYLQEEAARQLRQAEAAIRDKVRQAGLEAGSGGQVNVSNRYTVASNGSLYLTDSTITAGRNARAQTARETANNDAVATPALPAQNPNRAPVQFSDITRPSFSLPSSELAALFSNQSTASLEETAFGGAQEYVFVRGPDGSYYPIGDEASLGTGNNDASRLARDVANFARQGGADEETVRQATFNVAKVYATNVQNLLFGEGQLRAVA